jgi:hypothetical protein
MKGLYMTQRETDFCKKPKNILALDLIYLEDERKRISNELNKERLEREALQRQLGFVTAKMQGLYSVIKTLNELVFLK